MLIKGKISAVYKIVNTVTKDFYIGSSKDIKMRWKSHKCPSTRIKHSNRPLYRDMQRYGIDAFRFQILAPVVPEYLKEVEQELIDMLHPTYNKCRANGMDFEKRKESWKKYYQSDKGKENLKKKREKYCQSEKGKEIRRKADIKYKSQLCSYNGDIITLDALRARFKRAGVEHPTKEAKKYLLPQK